MVLQIQLIQRVKETLLSLLQNKKGKSEQNYVFQVLGVTKNSFQRPVLNCRGWRSNCLNFDQIIWISCSGHSIFTIWNMEWKEQQKIVQLNSHIIAPNIWLSLVSSQLKTPNRTQKQYWSSRAWKQWNLYTAIVFHMRNVAPFHFSVCLCVLQLTDQSCYLCKQPKALPHCLVFTC